MGNYGLGLGILASTSCLFPNPEWSGAVAGSAGESAASTAGRTDGSASVGATGGSSASATSTSGVTASESQSTSAPTAEDGATNAGCTAPRISLEVDLRSVDGKSTLTNFPLLVWVPARELSGELDGLDASELAFTVPGGRAQLAFEVEELSATGLMAWVLVPELDLANIDLLYLWPGRADAAGEDPAALWTAAGYAGVWHLGSVSNLSDSSGQQPDATVLGGQGLSAESGQIGGGLRFDGLHEGEPDDALVINGNWKGQLSDFTVSLWVTIDFQPDNSFQHPIFRNFNGHSLFPRSYISDCAVVLQSGFGPGGNSQHRAMTVPRPDAPHYIAITYDATAGDIATQVNGTRFAGSIGPGAPSGGSAPMELGRDLNLGSELAGALDEFRVSTIARTASWVQASYVSQADPASTVTVGESVEVPCP